MTDRVLINSDPLEFPEGVIAWPALLPEPTHSGYRFGEGEGRVFTTMAQGAPRVRQKYKNVPAPYSVRFLLPFREFQIWREYYKTALKGGSLRAAIPVHDERGKAYSFLLIQNTPQYTPVSRSGHYEFTLNCLEVGRAER